MKQILLIILIGLPSLLLAQPSLTFNPDDGDINVSTTADLTITSDVALKLADGTNIDDTNVDDLIQLLDEDMNPVTFNADESNGRKTITIDFVGPLQELHTYTLILESVENGAGEETGQVIITFTTGDFTDPSFNSAKEITNIGTGFTFKVNVSEDATVYYVVESAPFSLPTKANIRAGEKGGGGAADASGSFIVSGNTNTDEIITGLPDPSLKYYIYYFAEDVVLQESTVQIRGLPQLVSSSIQNVGSDGFTLRVKIDENATTYYVVTQSATAPTSAQIIAGENESGGAPVVSGDFFGTGGADEDEPITGLDDLTTYYVHFVSIDSDGNESVVGTESETTTDGTRPVVVTLSPADNSTGFDVDNHTYTITFDENVRTIDDDATDNNHRIRLFENGVQVATVDRDDDTGNTYVLADGSSTTATIRFDYDLSPHLDYYIVIGGDVFEDLAGNDFVGYSSATDWNFTSSGVTVNNLASNICSGSFQPIGNIIISEGAAGDFNSGNGQTLTLSLSNTAEFVIANSGVSASSPSGDVTNLSVSVGVTSLTITYDVTGNSTVDNITISGLKIYATGVVPSATIRRTGGDADQDGNNGTGGSSLTHATINVGATAPSQPQLAASQDLIHCADEDLTGKTLTLVDQGITYNWYRDAALSDLAISTTNETVNIVTDLGMTSPAVLGEHDFYVVAIDACQSAPPVEVNISVGANPVADAGPDKTGLDAVCTGTQVTLGGNPTLSVPSAPGAYTYSWQYVEDAPEPDAFANPTYTVTNGSTTTNAAYNFEVTVTDANGCSGTDAVTIEVKPTFNIFLTAPNSYTFTPSAPNQPLEAVPAGGLFTGVGVVQSGQSPVTYQFSPAVAHATDPNTLPKNFDIYYTVTQDGCTITDHHVATFTISNSFFSTLQPQYCANEYPNPNSAGVLLSLDANGQTYLANREASWNNNERITRNPYNTPWNSGLLYGQNAYVRYNNEYYRCNAITCTGLIPPDADASWVLENVLKVSFNGYIANYYEDYYGGNVIAPATVVKLPSQYTVNGETYNYYRFGTNLNYSDCPSCTNAWPAAYLEFERPEDIRFILPVWNVSYYFYRGDLVYYGGNVFKCLASSYTVGTQPDLNPSLWALVTNTDYGNGQYFHKWDASLGQYRSGFYVNGQYVQVNRNPTVFFSGLNDGQAACEFEVLDLDDEVSSSGLTFNLKGNYSNQALVQSFAVQLEGSGTFNLGGGAIVNEVTPGTATFDTHLAFAGSTAGASNLKNIKIRYEVDPGSDGSAGQACVGTSIITVQVRKNATFEFEDIVPADQSVFCYTEPAKDLRSESNDVIIGGTAGTANSVTYSGFGVNDLGNSLGTFRPAVALEQVSPGTSTQQSIPIVALYRDANLCLSTRERTFKVNPDIQPSFAFGGRVNYCYEDINNALTGHVQDFTVGASTVASTGKFELKYTDPASAITTLKTVNSSNTNFEAQALYDQVQDILDPTFASYLNQTVNINVVYTETLTAGAVCSEQFSQAMVINPPITLDIFGLTDGDILCRNDNNNVSQGHLVTFEGSVTGSGVFSLDDDNDFTAVNPTLDGTVTTLSGKATINLLSAYNAASDPEVFLQYEYTAPGCTGPAEAVKKFEISPPPALAFDDANSPDDMAVFCNGDAPVQLQTVETTNVVLSGYGISDSGTGSGVATFNPQLAFNTSVSNGGSSTQKQNITVSSRIVDDYGCANTTSIVYVVNPIPPTDVTFASTDFCYEDDPALISSPLARSWYEIEYLGVTTPHAESIGSINANQKDFFFDPQQRFDEATLTYGASALTPVSFNITYFTADPDDCIATIGPTQVSVANQIEVSIAGIADEIYCSNENKGKKLLTFNPFPADASKREFTINGGVPVPLSTDKYTFEPGLTGGDFQLEYIVYSGEKNCSNTATLEFKVLPSPQAIFEVPPACDGDLIPFTALGNNLADATYTWTLTDTQKTGQTIEHQFPATNIYGVQLLVQYPAYNNDPELVCKDSLRLDQTVGAVPKDLGFMFFNVCEEDATTFEVAPDVPISQFSWDFGDGIATGLGSSASTINGVTSTSGTYQTPAHQYATAGGYSLAVTGKTAAIFGGCERTEIHNIAILKNWTPTPGEPFYDMSQLDNGRGFWVVEDAAGHALWEFNSAAKKHIVTNDPAWVTGSTDPYNPEDDSYVNSPCFDLTGFSRPVFSMQHWTDTELSDGAVVQYSTDGGETWKRLGNVASGLAWYDRPTISSNPGEQPSGWSHADQREWAIGKHTLDVIPADQRQQVRFRIAFRSFNNLEALDGFAFNNVVIEERNRTILVENFTNEVYGANNLAFRNFHGEIFNTAELVKLQYHHASAQGPEPDDLHNDNPADQDARAAFYGVTTPVRAFVDGGFGQTSTNATFEAVIPLETYFNLRSLVTSPVNIAIDFESEPSDRLNVRATVQATSDLGAPGQYNVFIAVVEQSVDGQVYVLRKFLPNAGGTPLTSLTAADPPQEINVSYDMRQVTRKTDGSFEPFAVIVFVQHLETKDILQTIMRTDGTAAPTVVTGVETTYENYLQIYPSPADDIMNVILPSPAASTTPLKMFDSFGREVISDRFEAGQHIRTLGTKGLSAGMYFIQTNTPTGVVQKKVMIVHN